MATVFDLFVKLDEQDSWIILYLLERLGDNVGAKSKYIATILQNAYRKIVTRLIKLEQLGLVKKQQTFKTLHSDCYPTHWWFISERGKDLIHSKKKLDTERHFQTLQRLNELIPSPQFLIPSLNYLECKISTSPISK